MTLTPPAAPYHRPQRQHRQHTRTPGHSRSAATAAVSATAIRYAGGIDRILHAALALLIALATCVIVTQPASADENGGTAGGASGNGIAITIAEATAVVTASSGYHLKATITNGTENALEPGTLTLLTNSLYTFNSRTDIQQWAQAQVNIFVPNQVGSTAVPRLKPGASTTVSVDADSQQDALQAIVSWGPKPLLLDYTTEGGDHEQLHTFLTRSNAGLESANTPALNLTVAMPLTNDAWQVDDNAVTALLNDDDNASGDVVSLGENTQLEQSQRQLITKHRALQIIADPMALNELDDAESLPIAGVMQPAEFDITTYAASDNRDDYADAGVSSQDWNASAAQKLYRSATGKSKPAVYAWQGQNNWTMQSLTEARKQGYTTVITDHEFDESDNATVHTGNIVVSTEAGDITVLSQQRELGRLAQGKPTSGDADAETSTTGRLLRFMAQSAFYQMEQPYISRNLLVCLNADDTAADDALMTAIEQASWLNLTTLEGLSSEEPYASGDDAAQLVHDSASLDDKAQSKLDQTLISLSSARNDISRFVSSVLSDSSSQKSSDASSDTASGTTSGATGETGKDNTDSDNAASDDEASDSDDDSGDDAGNTNDTDKNSKNDKKTSTSGSGANTSDAQALARQDANKTSHRSSDATDWITMLLSAQQQLALHALGNNADVTAHMVDGATKLASKLLNSVSITPSESITVVSESAKMPVTISNAGPYPVHIRVSSATDSMEIVTSRITDVEVPANSEAQVTFTIRVSTSSSATARITLQDRNGIIFGTSQNTAITSVLRISDMTGFIIIALAAILGVLGLWRQFHRKKDPDE